MKQKLEFQIKDLEIPDWIKQRFETFVNDDPHGSKGFLRDNRDFYLAFVTLFGGWLEKWTMIRNQTGAGDLAKFRWAVEQFKAAGVIASDRAVLAASPGQAAIFASRGNAIKLILAETESSRVHEWILLEIDKKIGAPEITGQVSQNECAPAADRIAKKAAAVRRAGEIVSDADAQTAVELAFHSGGFPDLVGNTPILVESTIRAVARRTVLYAILFACVDDILEQRNLSATEALENFVIEEFIDPNRFSNNGYIGWKSFYKYGIHDLIYEDADPLGSYLGDVQHLLHFIRGDDDLIRGANPPRIESVNREANRQLEADSETLKSRIYIRVGETLCRKAWEITNSEEISTSFRKAIQALADDPRCSVEIDDLFRDSWKDNFPGQYDIKRWGAAPVLDSFFIDYCGYQYQTPRNVGLAAGYRGACESVAFCVLNSALGAIGCDHPARISLDRAGQLHDEQRKAIEWSDGWGVYALDGIALSEELWTKIVTKTITAVEIVQIANDDLRAIALKHNPAALINKKARLLDRDPLAATNCI